MWDFPLRGCIHLQWRAFRVRSSATRSGDPCVRKTQQREAGISNVRLHDLRHFAATQLLAAGVPVRTVAGRLGHANAATTLNVYAHVLESSDERGRRSVGATARRRKLNFQLNRLSESTQDPEAGRVRPFRLDRLPRCSRANLQVQGSSPPSSRWCPFDCQFGLPRSARGLRSSERRGCLQTE